EKWIADIQTISMLIADADPLHISIEAFKDAGVAAILQNAIFEGQSRAKIRNIITYDTPHSYRFDQREGVDYFSMAIHIPGFLKWGDISMAAALTDAQVTFVNAR